MHVLNATDLFEAKDKVWPASSESFWTGVFALFAIHLGSERDRPHGLTVWHPTDGAGNKYFAARTKRPSLVLRGVTFDSLTVEPKALSKPWPGTDFELPASAGGFSPDIVIRIPGDDETGHFVIIENKIAFHGCLADNQMKNYPELANWLISKRISFDFLLLQSVGCCKQLYEQAQIFQRMPWGERFGVLLWEEVFRVMYASAFTIGGLPFDAWQGFTKAIETDCAVP